MGADNVLYTKTDRFNAFQVGIGIPLFFGSQNAKISSSKTMKMISENNYQYGLQVLRMEYDAAYRLYQTQMQTVNYFEDTALKNADVITKTANQQFENGDINYLEWSMLINNATILKSSYSDAVHDLNQTIIQLIYLTSK